jgi:hypothetical protein
VFPQRWNTGHAERQVWLGRNAEPGNKNIEITMRPVVYVRDKLAAFEDRLERGPRRVGGCAGQTTQ